MRGLYKGVWPQIARDIPGRGIYFFAYDSVQKLLLKLARRGGEETSNAASVLAKMVAGGLAGPISWAYSYPLDKIKTEIQIQKGRISTKEVVSRIHKQAGLGGFYRGFSATLMYSFFVNSIRLPLFDYLNAKYCTMEASQTD